VEAHRLPLERTELVERLYLDPLAVLLRGDKPGNSFDVLRVVRQPRHEREAHPHRLSRFCQTLGKTKGWSQIAAGDLAVRLGVRALDIEEHKIDGGKQIIVGAIAEKARRFDRSVQT